MTQEQMNEKLAERKKIIDQQREMNAKCLTEKRNLTGDEQATYDKMQADSDSIKAIVDREHKLNEDAKENENRPESVRAALGADGEKKLTGPPREREYAEAYRVWARQGDANTPAKFKAVLEKAVNSQGGYLVPIDYETKIVLKMYDANVMRQLGTVTRTTSQVNIPMEANLPTFGWIAETGTYPATDASVGQVILGANKLGGIISISEELLEDAFLDVADYVASRAALAAGFAEEGAYVAGDGNNKPTGFLTTVLASGTTVTSAAPTVITSTDAMNLYYGVARPYRKNGSFLFADTAVKNLRLEKATTGQYIWAPSLVAGAPDTLLGKPVLTSDYLAAVAATSVSGAFGDFSYYQIVDRIGWSMQRLNELYAATGMVGFKMWERTDGKLLRPEAIVTLTQHA